MILSTVWALNVFAAVLFSIYFPDQFRALRELDSQERGLIFLIVPSIIVSFVLVRNSFGGANSRN